MHALMAQAQYGPDMYREIFDFTHALSNGALVVGMLGESAGLCGQCSCQPCAKACMHLGHPTALLMYGVYESNTKERD